MDDGKSASTHPHHHSRITHTHTHTHVSSCNTRPMLLLVRRGFSKHLVHCKASKYCCEEATGEDFCSFVILFAQKENRINKVHKEHTECIVVHRSLQVFLNRYGHGVSLSVVRSMYSSGDCQRREVNNTLFHAVPNIQETLLQLIHIVNA